MEMTRVQAIKTYFERVDNISPEGGRKVEMKEMKDLGGTGLAALGKLCAEELGVTLKTTRTK